MGRRSCSSREEGGKTGDGLCGYGGLGGGLIRDDTYPVLKLSWFYHGDE